MESAFGSRIAEYPGPCLSAPSSIRRGPTIFPLEAHFEMIQIAVVNRTGVPKLARNYTGRDFAFLRETANASDPKFSSSNKLRDCEGEGRWPRKIG
jgi:hypothetical protein